jgi:predicted transcriptional regulator
MDPETGTRWTFLTNHAYVLVEIARDPEARLRDVAERVGITERAAQRIVSDLAEAGYISRERVGRRNRYVVHGEVPLRHHLGQDRAVGELLDLFEVGQRIGGAGRQSS